jgi:hypothetical protein
MAQETATTQQTKISPEFVTRLASLTPDQKIRAIVMLQTGDAGVAISRRRASGQRDAVLRATRRQAEAALPDIDRVHDQFGGKRLSREVDALGGVSVETTVAGILGLTSLGRVKAVLEDQKISVIRQ